MTRKTAETGTITRNDLHAVYMYVVNNWAVYAEDIALAEAIHVKDVNKALNKLKRAGLLAGEKINNERRLTWQSHYDIENEHRNNGETLANADFNAAFPGETVTKSGGATGPRYTDAQIKAGLKAKKLGKTNKQVAEAAGVKSPSYFAKILKEIESKQETARQQRRNMKKSSAAKKATSGRVTRKGARERSSVRNTKK